MHEHIVTRSPGVHENWPHLFERNAILAMAQQKLADLHTRGIRTIVDLTTVDLGSSERARIAAEMLLERIEDPALTPRVVGVEPRLVVRASSGAQA